MKADLNRERGTLRLNGVEISLELIAGCFLNQGIRRNFIVHPDNSVSLFTSRFDAADAVVYFRETYPTAEESAEIRQLVSRLPIPDLGAAPAGEIPGLSELLAKVVTT